MVVTGTTGGHLTSGELVRQLDEQLEAGERARVEDHLRTCGACRDALAATGARAARISRLLLLADPPAATLAPPARRVATVRPRPSLARAAVIVLAVALAGLAAGPLRAWVEATWSALRGGFDAPQDAAAPATPEAGRGSTIGSDLSVSFAPPGDRLVVDLESGQAGGTLTLGAGEGDRVRASIEGGDGAEELLVLPDRLGIRNHPSSLASYQVLVPRAVGEVEVRVGGRTSQVVPRQEMIDGARRIGL